MKNKNPKAFYWVVDKNYVSVWEIIKGKLDNHKKFDNLKEVYDFIGSKLEQETSYSKDFNDKMASKGIHPDEWPDYENGDE